MAVYDGTAKPRERAERDELERLQKGPRVGFFDLEAARAQAAGSRKRTAVVPALKRLTWRDVSPICLPGFLISRAVAWLAGPLRRAGPSIDERLVRLEERLSDKPVLARHQALLRATARWLTTAPNDALQAIPEETEDGASMSPTADPLPGFEAGSSQRKAGAKE